LEAEMAPKSNEIRRKFDVKNDCKSNRCFIIFWMKKQRKEKKLNIKKHQNTMRFFEVF